MFENPQCARGSAQCKSDQGNSIASRRNSLLYHFLITIHLHFASLHATKYFEKKLAREMLIEQIIELEFRGPGLSDRTCTLTTG